jgi:hypothetical protein
VQGDRRVARGRPVGNPSALGQSFEQAPDSTGVGLPEVAGGRVLDDE